MLAETAKKSLVRKFRFTALGLFVIGCSAAPGDGLNGEDSIDGTDPMAETGDENLSGNLIANPSFEQNVNSWYSWQGAIARVAMSGAPDGAAVAKVARSSGSMYSLGGAGPIVSSIASGAKYSAKASVKAASASAVGKPITLILRERRNGQNVKLWYSTARTLTNAFQEVSVMASAPTAGNQLDFYLLQDRAVAGDAFYADNFSAGLGTTAPPPPPPPPVDAGAPPPVDSGVKPVDSGVKPPTDSGVTPPPPPPPGGPMGPSGTWNMVFADEFNGSALDGTKWNSGWYTSGVNASSPPVQSTELEYYSPQGIVFPGDGAVHLRLSNAGANSYGKKYQSGMIQSSNRFTFDPTKKPVVVESRIQVPGSQAHSAGYWPAFWILSNEDAAGGKGTWPPEIDIFEFFSSSSSARAHLHTSGGDINLGLNTSDGKTDLSLAYHTYTFYMSNSALTCYLDGVQQWTHTNAGNIARLLNPAPLYLLLNMQFGGAGGAPNANTIIPADMNIDYVRAWVAP